MWAKYAIVAFFECVMLNNTHYNSLTKVVGGYVLVKALVCKISPIIQVNYDKVFVPNFCQLDTPAS